MNKKVIAAAMVMALGSGAWAAEGAPVYGGNADSTNVYIPSLQWTPGTQTGGGLANWSPYDPPGMREFLAPIEGPIVSNFVPASPELQIQSSDGQPVVTQIGSGGEPVPGTISAGSTFTPGTGGQPAVLTAVSATASQSYSLYVSGGITAPNMQTFFPNSSAEVGSFTSAEASPGGGVTINNALDAANYIATTKGVTFDNDPATGIYWGYAAGVGPDGYGLLVDAGKHYLFGPPVTNMPTSGTATYTLVGNTTPSITVAGNVAAGDSTGNTFTSGNFTANFSAKTLTTPAMTMNFPAQGGGNPVPTITLSIPAGQTITYGTGAPQGLNVTCTAGCSGVSGNINTSFTGSGASGLGVAITANGGSVPVTLSSGTTLNSPISASVVAAYKKL